MSRNEKWSLVDLANAMRNSVLRSANPKFIKEIDGKILFNGFWRGGDKQNVCVTLEKASWHDAKTGDWGGCKNFANVAFNLSLPDFMEKFGETSYFPSLKVSSPPNRKKEVSHTLDAPWNLILERNRKRSAAQLWLKERGFDSPQESIGSGFACIEEDDLTLFDLKQRSFIKHRLSLGPQFLAPLRSWDSPSIKNLFFRSMQSVNKNDKSRLLPDAGGWTENDGSPRAFGFPHLIHDFPKLILCEGMADYFAAECLLNDREDMLPIGAANASALVNWANCLVDLKYKGVVQIIYQLDTDQNGNISSDSIGQSKATQALKILLTHKISASLFKWASFLKNIPFFSHIPNDIADICKNFGSKSISEQFVATLNEAHQ
jgi:hypothetical protein